jgi:hypothetical protein
VTTVSLYYSTSRGHSANGDPLYVRAVCRCPDCKRQFYFVPASNCEETVFVSYLSNEETVARVLINAHTIGDVICLECANPWRDKHA